MKFSTHETSRPGPMPTANLQLGVLSDANTLALSYGAPIKKVRPAPVRCSCRHRPAYPRNRRTSRSRCRYRSAASITTAPAAACANVSAHLRRGRIGRGDAGGGARAPRPPRSEKYLPYPHPGSPGTAKVSGVQCGRHQLDRARLAKAQVHAMPLAKYLAR